MGSFRWLFSPFRKKSCSTEKYGFKELIPGSDEARKALLRRVGEAIAWAEHFRQTEKHRPTGGRLQELLTDLQTVRARLETVPQDRLVRLATLEQFDTFDAAVRATAREDTDSAREQHINAARDAMTGIAAQLA